MIFHAPGSPTEYLIELCGSEPDDFGRSTRESLLRDHERTGGTARDVNFTRVFYVLNISLLKI